MQPLVVKVTHGTTLRRLTLPRDPKPSLTALFTLICQRFSREYHNCHHSEITYTDSDGDTVTIGSDDELDELIATLKDDTTPLRIRLVTYGAAPTTEGLVLIATSTTPSQADTADEDAALRNDMADVDEWLELGEGDLPSPAGEHSVAAGLALQDQPTTPSLLFDAPGSTASVAPSETFSDPAEDALPTPSERAAALAADEFPPAPSESHAASPSPAESTFPDDPADAPLPPFTTLPGSLSTLLGSLPTHAESLSTHFSHLLTSPHSALGRLSSLLSSPSSTFPAGSSAADLSVADLSRVFSALSGDLAQAASEVAQSVRDEADAVRTEFERFGMEVEQERERWRGEIEGAMRAAQEGAQGEAAAEPASADVPPLQEEVVPPAPSAEEEKVEEEPAAPLEEKKGTEGKKVDDVDQSTSAVDLANETPEARRDAKDARRRERAQRKAERAMRREERAARRASSVAATSPAASIAGGGTRRAISIAASPTFGIPADDPVKTGLVAVLDQLVAAVSLASVADLTARVIAVADRSAHETDAKTLKLVALVLFEYATAPAAKNNPHTTRALARLAVVLSERIDGSITDAHTLERDGAPAKGGALFRRVLLTLAQTSFRVSPSPALVRFIGALCVQGLVGERVAFQCASALAGRVRDRAPEPDEADVEMLCVLLESVGETLEGEHKAAMEGWLGELLSAFSATNSLSAQVKGRIVQNLLALCENSWRQPVAAPAPLPQPAPIPQSTAIFSGTSSLRPARAHAPSRGANRPASPLTVPGAFATASPCSSAGPSRAASPAPGYFSGLLDAAPGDHLPRGPASAFRPRGAEWHPHPLVIAPAAAMPDSPVLLTTYLLLVRETLGPAVDIEDPATKRLLTEWWCEAEGRGVDELVERAVEEFM
ncbi:hypothetical protein JCM10207_005143 [Rhodosporidiobolus poonsookiae]